MEAKVESTVKGHPSFRRAFAQQTAGLMFVMALVFLANTAAIIVLWVDVPRVNEAYRELIVGQGEVATNTASNGQILEVGSLRLGYASVAFAGFLWPIFMLELLIYWWTGELSKREVHEGVLACIWPPLRLAKPNPEMSRKIWLPVYGWRDTDKDFQKQLEKAFGLPMIIIALMILPILLVEFGLKAQIAERMWLRILLHVSTATIWFAFAFEFILMWSIADKKLRYCKEHWLDLAIIILPVISFLRSLRIVRATQIGRLAKVQHVAKVARMYRMRGLAIKAFRAMLLFEVLDRFLGNTPEKRLRGLKEKLSERESEVESLRQQIAAIEEVLAHRSGED